MSELILGIIIGIAIVIIYEMYFNMPARAVLYPETRSIEITCPCCRETIKGTVDIVPHGYSWYPENFKLKCGKKDENTENNTGRI
jgi:hypothetical protein